VLFFPVSVLAAKFLIELAQFFQERLASQPARRVVGVVAVAFMTFVLVYGGWSNRDVINKTTVLADQDDLDALNWINTHLPADARFFINTAPWGFGLYRGVDGGAWITPYNGRWSLVPTNFYPFGMEATGKKLVMDWGERTSTINACDTQFWKIVAEADLEYAYLTQRTGNLQATTMDDCPGSRLMYDSGGVSIWLLKNTN